MNDMNARERQQLGLTLVELMVGLVVGLLVVGMVSALFLNSTRSYRQDERISGLNDELRFAIGQLIEDIEMAGFYGTMIDPALVRREIGGVDTLAALDGCGPGNLLQFGQPIDGLNSATGDQVNARFPCISASEVYEGIDGSGTGALRLNRVSGRWITRAELDAGAHGVYLQTLSTKGGMSPSTESGGYEGPLDADCAAAPDRCRYWENLSSIYFVRNFTVAGNATPCLTRKRLRPAGGSVAPVSECLVSGVEDFQVLFGIDQGGAGAAEYYTSTPSNLEMAAVVALQLHVLLRSVEPDGSYRNLKTYVLGDKVVTPGEDRFYRRLGSVAVPLRNVQAQRTFQ